MYIKKLFQKWDLAVSIIKFKFWIINSWLMTNFKEKIRSVHNKNLLVNLAPKLKWYHFHRVSNLELKFRIKVKNFTKFLQLMADFQCAKGCVILLYETFALQSKHFEKENNIKSEICPKLYKKSTFVFPSFESLWKWYNVNFGAK